MSKAKQNTNAKSLEISCIAPDAKEVFVAGTFSGWERTPMKSKPDGLWVAKLSIEPGEHEYKFVVDGEWCCKPGVSDHDPALLTEGDYVANSYGTTNCKLLVS